MSSITVGLVPGDDIITFVLKQLLKGLHVQVTIKKDGEEKVVDGLITQIEFGRGGDHVLAMVYFPGPVIEGTSTEDYCKVAIYNDGKIIVMDE